MKPLKNDTAGHGYCGPIVVGCITGKPLSEVLDAIRERRGWRGHGRKPAVRGTHTGDLVYAFRKFGYRMAPLPIDVKRGFPKSPTLAAYLRKRSAEERQATLVIEVTGHWVAVTGRKFVDTFTKGQPVWLKDAPGRRKRVRGVWRIIKDGEPQAEPKPKGRLLFLEAALARMLTPQR